MRMLLASLLLMQFSCGKDEATKSAEEVKTGSVLWGYSFTPFYGAHSGAVSKGSGFSAYHHFSSTSECDFINKSHIGLDAESIKKLKFLTEYRRSNSTGESFNPTPEYIYAFSSPTLKIEDNVKFAETGEIEFIKICNPDPSTTSTKHELYFNATYKEPFDMDIVAKFTPETAWTFVDGFTIKHKLLDVSFFKDPLTLISLKVDSTEFPLTSLTEVTPGVIGATVQLPAGSGRISKEICIKIEDSSNLWKSYSTISSEPYFVAWSKDNIISEVKGSDAIWKKDTAGNIDFFSSGVFHGSSYTPCIRLRLLSDIVAGGEVLISGTAYSHTPEGISNKKSFLITLVKPD